MKLDIITKTKLDRIITERLDKFKTEVNIDFIKERYSEEQRFYHTMDHIYDLLDKAIKFDALSDDLFLAILFHDIVYDPREENNELKSTQLFQKYFPDNETVANAIFATKTHSGVSPLSNMLNELDLSILYGDFISFMEYEDNIFKEYQFVDILVYKKNRIKFLESNFKNIKPEYIDYIRNRQYKIGIYAGSFNPFHKGHLDILEKAEQIFDKVIIARGINPSKTDDFRPLPNKIKYRQIAAYDRLLTDFIDGLGYNTTLIRGLRNATDLEYEKTQQHFLQDLKPDIKVINIIGDSKFEHLSSSSIKVLQKYNRGGNYLV